MRPIRAQRLEVRSIAHVMIFSSRLTGHLGFFLLVCPKITRQIRRGRRHALGQIFSPYLHGDVVRGIVLPATPFRIPRHGR